MQEVALIGGRFKDTAVYYVQEWGTNFMFQDHYGKIFLTLER